MVEVWPRRNCRSTGLNPTRSEPTRPAFITVCESKVNAKSAPGLCQNDHRTQSGALLIEGPRRTECASHRGNPSLHTGGLFREHLADALLKLPFGNTGERNRSE